MTILQILSGKNILEHKTTGELYYRKSIPNINILNLQNSIYPANFLQHLIVLKFVPIITPNPTMSKYEFESELITSPINSITRSSNCTIINMIGCWNSECNTLIYPTHNMSFNQTIIRDIMLANPANLTILLGDNVYPRPDFIVYKTESDSLSEILDSDVDKKNPNNYQIIIKNGFECMTTHSSLQIPYFVILGNHDMNKHIMKYEINLTYNMLNLSGLKSSIRHADGIDIFECSNWIMPEEFYVLQLNGLHYLMLNSNIFYNQTEINEWLKTDPTSDTYKNAYVSQLQMSLIDEYLNNLTKSTNLVAKQKNVIMCFHEPIFAIGHKEKNKFIDNSTLTHSGIYQLITKYSNLIHSVYCADEHNTQFLKKDNINYIIASGAPYSGGDLIYEINPNPKLNIEIQQVYNSSVLVQSKFDQSKIDQSDFDQSALKWTLTNIVKLPINSIRSIENMTNTNEVIHINMLAKVIDKLPLTNKFDKTLLSNAIKKYLDKYKSLYIYSNTSSFNNLKFKPEYSIDNSESTTLKIANLTTIYDEIINLLTTSIKSLSESDKKYVKLLTKPQTKNAINSLVV